MATKRKGEAPFNAPFAKLKELRGAQRTPEPPRPAPAPPPPPPPPTTAARGPSEDERLFLESVGEVSPVRGGAPRVGPPPPRTVDEVHIPTEEAESLARLAELVSGEGPFDLADSDEFVEGAVHGFDVRVMRKLRAGEFSTQAHVDLHGLTREEARAALDRFIQRSRVAGHRCVLVVTGRGLHSRDQVPVLKQGVQAWLTRGATAKQVLAFCSARPKDGGSGAVYVLLRR